MKRLSIIVPIYNVDKYLAKCLDSLLNQDIPLSDYEIIMVNDGSSDSSRVIAESYVNQYSNIKLFSQENKGLGAARNLGIREAEGRCFFFVDSDDYIKSNTLSLILESFENNELDVLRFNYLGESENGRIISKRKSETFSLVFSKEIVDGETFLSEHLGWACYVWVYLFSSALIKNNQLLFNEKIYFEDVEWLVRLMIKAKRVQSINEQVYTYLQRSGSITQSIQLEKKNKIISDKLYIVDFLKQFSEETKNNKVILWCEGMISLIFMGILAYVENELPEKKKDIFSTLNQHKFLPLKSYRFTLKQKRDMFLINLYPPLYCYFKKR